MQSRNRHRESQLASFSLLLLYRLLLPLCCFPLEGVQVQSCFYSTTTTFTTKVHPWPETYLRWRNLSCCRNLPRKKASKMVGCQDDGLISREREEGRKGRRKEGRLNVVLGSPVDIVPRERAREKWQKEVASTPRAIKGELRSNRGQQATALEILQQINCLNGKNTFSCHNNLSQCL